MPKPDSLPGQPCALCHKKTLTLMESQEEIPYFGKVYLFSMNCSDCKYSKADIEVEGKNEPTKYTFEVQGQEDLNVRVVRSSDGTIKIPHIGTLEPGPSAEGFITNVEGVIERFKKTIEHLRDSAEDNTDRKKAKNMLKKIQKVLWGNEKIKIIIEDPSGNSAIISDKAEKKKL